MFYGLVIVGTVGGVLLSVLYSDPIGLLVFSALVNGVAAAPFMVMVMLISGDETLMGEHRNGKLATVLGWTATGAMSVAGAFGLFQAIRPG